MARRNQDEEANAPFGRYISDRIIFWLDRWRPIAASRHDLLYNQRRSRQGRRSRWIGRCRCALPVAGTDCWRGQQDLACLPQLTCQNWTSSSSGIAMIGHADRAGNPPVAGSQNVEAYAATARSWNAAHTSRSCSQPDLIATGGNGLFYCFAAQ